MMYWQSLSIAAMLRLHDGRKGEREAMVGLNTTITKGISHRARAGTGHLFDFKDLYETESESSEEEEEEETVEVEEDGEYIGGSSSSDMFSSDSEDIADNSGERVGTYTRRKSKSRRRRRKDRERKTLEEELEKQNMQYVDVGGNFNRKRGCFGGSGFMTQTPRKFVGEGDMEQCLREALVHYSKQQNNQQRQQQRRQSTSTGANQRNSPLSLPERPPLFVVSVDWPTVPRSRAQGWTKAMQKAGTLLWMSLSDGNVNGNSKGGGSSGAAAIDLLRVFNAIGPAARESFLAKGEHNYVEEENRDVYKWSGSNSGNGNDTKARRSSRRSRQRSRRKKQRQIKQRQAPAWYQLKAMVCCKRDGRLQAYLRATDVRDEDSGVKFGRVGGGEQTVKGDNDDETLLKNLWLEAPSSLSLTDISMKKDEQRVDLSMSRWLSWNQLKRTCIDHSTYPLLLFYEDAAPGLYDVVAMQRQRAKERDAKAMKKALQVRKKDNRK